MESDRAALVPAGGQAGAIMRMPDLKIGISCDRNTVTMLVISDGFWPERRDGGFPDSGRSQVAKPAAEQIALLTASFRRHHRMAELV